MRECGHDEVGNHTLLGFLTLRYGAAMVPSEISLQMNAKQAGRLAQGLLMAMSVGGGKSDVPRGSTG